MKKSAFFFIVIILLSSSPIKADSLIKETTDTIIQKKDVELHLSESQAYKLLYENAKENNEKTLATVQWTIGVSIAFLLAILGSQIFFNWRINKKEIDYIKKDIEEKIGDLKAELVKNLDDENKSQEAKLNRQFDKLNNDISSKIKDDFEKNNKFNDLNNKVKDFEIESAKNEFKSGIKELKIDIEKIEGDLWKIKGVEANALSSYLRTALLQIELNREVKYILDDIISLLGNLEEIHELDLQNLDKLINLLPIQNSGQKEKIISLYKDKPVYQFLERVNNFGLGAMFGPGKKYVKNAPK